MNQDLYTIYASFLLQENQKYNLTSIVDSKEIQEKHFEDSLLLLDIAELPQGAAIIDIGSGAGFPGVPLRIARPDLRLTLLESTGKKARFLRELREQLGLPFEVINERAEVAAHQAELRGHFDWAVSRAVAALPVLCELCLPFVKTGGCFAAYKGAREKALLELRQSQNALRVLGAQAAQAETKQMGHGERTLILLKKISQTPGNYPRNHGAMLKKPL